MFDGFRRYGFRFRIEREGVPISALDLQGTIVLGGTLLLTISLLAGAEESKHAAFGLWKLALVQMILLWFLSILSEMFPKLITPILILLALSMAIAVGISHGIVPYNAAFPAALSISYSVYYGAIAIVAARHLTEQMAANNRLETDAQKARPAHSNR